MQLESQPFSEKRRELLRDFVKRPHVVDRGSKLRPILALSYAALSLAFITYLGFVGSSKRPEVTFLSFCIVGDRLDPLNHWDVLISNTGLDPNDAISIKRGRGENPDLYLEAMTFGASVKRPFFSNVQHFNSANSPVGSDHVAVVSHHTNGLLSEGEILYGQVEIPKGDCAKFNPNLLPDLF